MKTSSRRTFTATCIAVAALPASSLALAADPYPCKTLTLVSPYPPGGTTDILARMVAPEMAAELGVTVIVDNRGGASSNIGTAFVSRAQPDGCPALLGNNTGVVINRNLYPLKMDPVHTLAPVGEVASVPLLLYVNAAIPASNAAGSSDVSGTGKPVQNPPQGFAARIDPDDDSTEGLRRARLRERTQRMK